MGSKNPYQDKKTWTDIKKQITYRGEKPSTNDETETPRKTNELSKLEAYDDVGSTFERNDR